MLTRWRSLIRQKCNSEQANDSQIEKHRYPKPRYTCTQIPEPELTQ